MLEEAIPTIAAIIFFNAYASLIYMVSLPRPQGVGPLKI
jgi:hypothetical protein